MVKLEIGAGGPAKEGFISVDVRALPGVQFVTPAWDLVQWFDGAVDEIYSRHMLEHLTLEEARRTLREWARVLRPQGLADIIVPNRAFHLRQLTEMPRGSRSEFGPWTNFQHGMAGLYGWQNNEHDVHKWAWIAEELVWELGQAGFARAYGVADRECDCHVKGIR
jgi:predicted SAM-dependent methyltransferase